MKEHHSDLIFGEDVDNQKKRKRTKEDDCELPGFDPLPKQFNAVSGTFV